MRKGRVWLLSSLVCLALVLLLACAPRATPTPGPAPTPTTQPKSSPIPSPSPTAKPTPSETPISFAGKTVTITVASEAGGGTDTGARIAARGIARYLPGKPTIVVRNMPGGFGTIGVNYVYTAKPDGLTLHFGSSTPLVNQMLGTAGVKYDILKMPAVMGTSETNIMYVKKSVADKPEDVTKAQGLIFGFSTGSSGQWFVISAALLNIPIHKLTLAYAGTADSSRAFVSGEINASVASLTSYKNMVVPEVPQGQAIVVAQMSLVDARGNVVRDPAFPREFHTVGELYEKIYGKPPSGIVWDVYKTIAAIRGASRVLYLPPNVPESILRTWYVAAEQTIKDAEFDEFSRRLNPADWGAGESYDKALKAAFKPTREVVDWLTKELAKYGVTPS